jgi:hypothetical protein
VFSAREGRRREQLCQVPFSLERMDIKDKWRFHEKMVVHLLGPFARPTEMVSDEVSYRLEMKGVT